MNAPLILLAHCLLAGSPVEMAVTACPLTVAKHPPSCSFAAVEGAKGPFKRMERISCDTMNPATFVPSTGAPQLMVQMTFVEAGTWNNVLFLRTPSGETRGVPAGLSAPFLLGDAVAGVLMGSGAKSFWVDGHCEGPATGWVQEAVPLGEREVVALVFREDRQTELMRRSAEAKWSSLGLIPNGFAPSLQAAGGRVALTFTLGTPADQGELFPELGRTRVRFRSDTDRTASFLRAAAPLAPAAGSVFSPAIAITVSVETWAAAVDLADERGRPRRVALVSQAPGEGCRLPPTYASELAAVPPDGEALTYSAPALVALGERRALVAWVRTRQRCHYAIEPALVQNCPPGAPCAAPPGPTWKMTVLSQVNELVVTEVDAKAREVARVTLDPARPPRPRYGVSLALQGDALFAQAYGYFFEFELSKLQVTR